MPEFIEASPDDSTAWTCLCGNQPESDGFFPVSLDTVTKAKNFIGPSWIEVSPDADGPWDGVHYGCFRCGRVIDQRTLRVVGRGFTQTIF